MNHDASQIDSNQTMVNTPKQAQRTTKTSLKKNTIQNEDKAPTYGSFKLNKETKTKEQMENEENIRAKDAKKDAKEAVKANKEALEEIMKENRESAARTKANITTMTMTINNSIGHIANLLTKILNPKIQMNKYDSPASGKEEAELPTLHEYEQAEEHDMFSTAQTPPPPPKQSHKPRSQNEEPHDKGEQAPSIQYYSQSDSIPNTQPQITQQMTQEQEQITQPTQEQQTKTCSSIHQELMERLTRQEELSQKLEEKIRKLEESKPTEENKTTQEPTKPKMTKKPMPAAPIDLEGNPEAETT